MKTKNIITALTIILIIAIGVVIIQILVQFGCLSLLFMMKNPITTLNILFSASIMIFLANVLYKKIRK
jgi:hypothetical protein